MRLKLVVLAGLAGLAFGMLPVTAQEKTGVAACDEVATKYEACIRKMPEAQQADAKAFLAQTTALWKAMAGSPQTKPLLEMTCTQAVESIKASMAKNGCPW